MRYIKIIISILIASIYYTTFAWPTFHKETFINYPKNHLWGWYYSSEDNEVKYKYKNWSRFLYVNTFMDTSSFQALTYEYATHNSKIYYKWKEIINSNADYLNFIVPSTKNKKWLLEWKWIASEGNNIYYWNWVILDVDIDTFKVLKIIDDLDNWVWKDKNNIYINSQKINWSNLYAFHFLNTKNIWNVESCLSKDDKYYYDCKWKIDIKDPESFLIIYTNQFWDWIWKDKYNVYKNWTTTIVWDKIVRWKLIKWTYKNSIIIENADAKSYSIFKQYKNLDPVPREFITWWYDKNNIFYKSKIFNSEDFHKYSSIKSTYNIPPDVNSFKLYVSDHISPYTRYDWWGVDKDNIYSTYGNIKRFPKNEWIKIDWESFELTWTKKQNWLVTWEGFAKDKYNVFFRHKIISNDWKNMEPLWKWWYADNTNIYYKNKKIELLDLDMSTLNINLEKYKEYIPKTKKNQRVNNNQRVIVKDKQNTYIIQFSKYMDKIDYVTKNNIIDLKTFKELSSRKYSDKNNVYKKVDLYTTMDNIYVDFEIIEWQDSDTMKNIRGEWSWFTKDKNTVYFQNIPLQWSDPKTFKLTENTVYWIDRNQAYFFIFWPDPSIKYFKWADYSSLVSYHDSPDSNWAIAKAYWCPDRTTAAKDIFNIYCNGIKINSNTWIKYYLFYLYKYKLWIFIFLMLLIIKLIHKNYKKAI